MTVRNCYRHAALRLECLCTTFIVTLSQCVLLRTVIHNNTRSYTDRESTFYATMPTPVRSGGNYNCLRGLPASRLNEI